jgi:hypothetical protein
MTAQSRHINFSPKKQGLVHPEQKNDREFFLGNFDAKGIAQLGKKWTTLRIGETAFDPTGVPYPKTIQERYRPRPVFVNRNEALERYHNTHYTGIASRETVTEIKREFLEQEKNTPKAQQEYSKWTFTLALLVFIALVWRGGEQMVPVAALALLSSLFLLLGFRIAKKFLGKIIGDSEKED